MVNTNRMEIVIITWGATIVSLKCPDKYGYSADIVLGFDNIKGIILLLIYNCNNDSIITIITIIIILNNTIIKI